MIREFDPPRVDHWIRIEHLSDDLRGLYAANPIWAALERRVYGGLPIDDMPPDLTAATTPNPAPKSV